MGGCDRAQGRGWRSREGGREGRAQRYAGKGEQREGQRGREKGRERQGGRGGVVRWRVRTGAARRRVCSNSCCV